MYKRSMKIKIFFVFILLQVKKNESLKDGDDADIFQSENYKWTNGTDNMFPEIQYGEVFHGPEKEEFKDKFPGNADVKTVLKYKESNITSYIFKKENAVTDQLHTSDVLYAIPHLKNNKNISKNIENDSISRQSENFKSNLLHRKAVQQGPNYSEPIQIIQTKNNNLMTSLVAAPTEITSPDGSNTNNQNNLFLNNETDIIAHKSTLKTNHSEICTCDLKVDECDINCCCDQECSKSIKEIFTACKNSSNTFKIQHTCISSNLIFKSNMDHKRNENGLFCVVTNNFHSQLTGEDENIKDLKHFEKKIMGKNLYRYSILETDKPKINQTSYQMGDYVWSIKDNTLVPFGVPKSDVNMQCKSLKYIQYLSDYSSQCSFSVPVSRHACEKANDLEMSNYLRITKIITSPTMIKRNSSNEDEVCRNETCAAITSYICTEEANFSSCEEASPKGVLWDRDTCMNVVSSVEYHFYHNGIEGIRKVRAYFSVANISRKDSGQFLRKIKVKFLWGESYVPTFSRSGNPGYILGKPIMAGRKVYNTNNDTTSVKKEAIELSFDAREWLTVSGNNGGKCAANIRQPITFGENLQYSCNMYFSKNDFATRKCVDFQERVFKFLLGDDFINIKKNNKLNKFVATFGNSKVEETGDWVGVIIDLFPIVSSLVQYVSYHDIAICKNIITDLYVDIAFSKIGSFEKPQAKILGVHYYFGPLKTLTYSNHSKISDVNSYHMTKISSFIHFIDLTRKPEAEYSETPGFEAKLPHDFFYPFFSSGSISVYPYELFFLAIIYISVVPLLV